MSDNRPSARTRVFVAPHLSVDVRSEAAPRDAEARPVPELVEDLIELRADPFVVAAGHDAKPSERLPA